MLTRNADGLDAIDVGVIDGVQYALVPGSGNVYRRPASHAGTYGGWRWESTAGHILQYRTNWPELADAIEKAGL